MPERSNYIVPRRATDLDGAQRVIRRLVRQILTSTNGYSSPDGRILQVSVPVDHVDLFDWLQAQQGGPRGYWSSRDGEEQVAMIGAADVCQSTEGVDFPALEARLSARLWDCDAGVRYYGGMRFDAGPPQDAVWARFGAYRMVLPRYELRRQHGESALVCNIILPRDRQHPHLLLRELDDLATPADAPATLAQRRLPTPVFREDRPDEAGWRHNINWALDVFTQSPLSKVVLARQATFGFAEAVDPFLLLRRLKDAAPHRFHFCFEEPQGAAFVGASPERLFKQQDRKVWSEAVAGTRPRGDTDDADQQLRDELLLSEKEQREHEYVRQSIKEVLSARCITHHIDTTASEMKLAQGRHLVSASYGTLRDGVSAMNLLEGLHPTPAVGGYPKQEAMDAIAHLEPFDRGWYAGPVGWIGRHDAEFAVAIRSGLVYQKSLALYSGAGIVRGSTPVREWDEIEQKIYDFVNVLGLDLRRAK